MNFEINVFVGQKNLSAPKTADTLINVCIRLETMLDYLTKAFVLCRKIDEANRIYLFIKSVLP
jgi:hypothetical protein